ncbi:MAG: phosphatidylcholine/phosphatidylserine synthase [Alphaproteobacteria bacterium]|nr:phosphatidylcholine/phosphatidylserine synthase [Alphaproteobacteria bacterium]
MSQTAAGALAHRSRRAAAWAVHALTASGAVLGFLALEAAWRADTAATFTWLGIALIVDGLDGPLARRLAVEDALPRIDGAILDLVVDYLTYVVAPVAWLLATAVYPPEIARPLAGFVLVTSLYTFARRDMKTDDADFRGFPAVWNVVAAGFAVTAAAPWVAAGVTLVLGLMTFTSLRAVHPVRVRSLRLLTLATVAAWMTATAAIVIFRDGSAAWLALWWTATVYVTGLCAVRSYLARAW